jgi:16S rRNA (guanine966-N2)-methyltransferase
MARRGGRGGAGQAPSLRIVAGEFGGRRLHSPPGEHMRPTAARTREAIFSMTGPIEGAVADLFCGSGALGLEALSRGAERVTFVDRDVSVVERNVIELGVEDRCELISARLPAAAGPSGQLAGAIFDLDLCDPPYTLAADLGPELDKQLAQMLAPGGLLIVESAAAAPMPLADPGLVLRRERKYGVAHVAIYEAAGR